MKRFCIVSVGVALLSGCTVFDTNAEKDFLCEAQDGIPCATIDEADGGSAAKGHGIEERAEDAMAASLTVPTVEPKTGATFDAFNARGYGYEGNRYRVPEVIGRMWIAPYLDENKILHEGRFVHFVVSEARWVQR